MLFRCDQRSDLHALLGPEVLSGFGDVILSATNADDLNGPAKRKKKMRLNRSVLASVSPTLRVVLDQVIGGAEDDDTTLIIDVRSSNFEL